MDRQVISQRITSILGDISRLQSALYAMNTTDIQRYPDNYEVLSTDAALRSESIACRLRHLIYATTTVKKAEYLQSASVMHGIEIRYENGVLEVMLPSLLPKRKQRQSTEFLIDPVYFALNNYADHHPMPKFSHCVVCFTAGNSQPDGCGIMTIWNSSNFWMSSPPLSWQMTPAFCATPTTRRNWGNKTVPVFRLWIKSPFQNGFPSAKTT